MRRLFLINPTAGGLRRLPPDATPANSRTPTSWSDAREQTRRALHDGVDQIVAVGGDGTLNAVINGFFENEKPIRPDALLVATNCGTGSDYFKSIAPRFAWPDLLDQFTARPVDVGVIEHHGDTRFFLNIASLGISPAIAAHKWRWKLPIPTPSKLAYLVPTLRAIRQYQPLPVTIRGEGFEFEGDILNCFIAKGIYCGGGMRFGGKVALDDGRFDVTVVGRLSFSEILARLPAIYGAGLRDEAKIRRRVSSWLAVRSAVALQLECDGEVPVRFTEAHFRVERRAVRICFPSAGALYL